MKCNYCLRVVFSVFLATLPLAGRATVFFNDTFGSGSTVSSTSPAIPTANSTAYQEISTKAWVPNPPTIAANDMTFGIGSSSSGAFQIQSLFATNALTLTQPNDYIQLAIVFTNTSGVLTASGQLGIGLYDSGQVQPLPGGTNNATTAITLTGYAQNWSGYMAILGSTNGNSSKIFTRPAQTVTTGNNQDLVSNGSSASYANAVQIGGTYGAVNALSAGSTVTEVLTITMIDASHLAITNTLYSGAGTGGTVLTNYGAVATGATLLTAGFDGFAIGYRSRSATALSNTIDVASIEVSGSVTTVSGPPTIDAEPADVSVGTNGSCYFEVAATGSSVTYQWHRNGAILNDGGNITGATSNRLLIDNANVGDQFSGANGYYCVVTGAGNYSTNSTTNSLTLVASKNLVWNGAGTDWDLNTSLNWNDLDNANNQTNFNFGDSVTFDDTGAGNANVTLAGNFLSASQWRITGSTAYAFGGTGSFAGAGPLIFNSSAGGNIQLNVINTHTGGTIVSNDNAALIVYCQKYQVLGNGPLTLAKPGILEFSVSGGGTLGIPGGVNVNDDFTIQFDGTGAYAGVFLGDIAGVAGKTLGLNPGNTSAVNRFRAYGANTVCDANIAINPNGVSTSQAQYDGTVFAPYGSGTQTYNGVISGYGGIIQRNGTTILNGANTYSGGTTPTTGSIGLGNDQSLGAGPLIIAPEVPSTTGSGTVFAAGGTRTIATSLVYPSGTNNLTLIIGGTNNITFTSAIDLNGLDNTGNPGSRTFQINNTGATVLSGTISDSSANSIGFNKTGSGVLYLNGASTFAGVTTNTAGRLAGTGSLTGSVVVKTNASISGGSAAAVGTLTVGGDLTLENGGGGFFRVNRSGFVSDKVSVTGALTSSGTGTITVTNLGAALQIGDTFTLFNKAVMGGNTLVVTGAVSAGLTWTNKLAVDGTIQVVQSFATYSTNISYTVSGSTLTITWPATHQGWLLQAQTNTLSTGLGTNWVTIPGTSATTTTNLPIVPGIPSVFYRLKMP